MVRSLADLAVEGRSEKGVATEDSLLIYLCRFTVRINNNLPAKLFLEA